MLLPLSVSLPYTVQPFTLPSSPSSTLSPLPSPSTLSLNPLPGVHLSQVLLPRTKSLFFQRFSNRSGKKKTETVGVGGELEVGRSPLSELGGDRLKEMEKIHTMEAEEVGYT